MNSKLRRRQFYFWHGLGVVIGFTAFILLITKTPIPQSECEAFAGTLARFDRTGRRGSTVYAVLRTDQGEKRYRTNSRLIGRRLHAAAIGTHVAGLTNAWGHVVCLKLNHQSIVSYEAVYDEERWEAHLCAWPSLLLGCWMTMEIFQAWRRPVD